MLGSTANSQGNPSVPIQSTGLPYASLAGITATNPAAASFTNGGPVLTYVEVEPLLNFQFWYNGKDTLYVGVNGRAVMSIVGGPAGNLGVVGVTAGATVNVTTQSSPSFYSTVQLAAGLATFQPPIGNPINMLPLVPLGYVAGFANTTVNVRSLYLDEFTVGCEIN
jgi:hypothetical protein